MWMDRILHIAHRYWWTSIYRYQKVWSFQSGVGVIDNSLRLVHLRFGMEDSLICVRRVSTGILRSAAPFVPLAKCPT
jgi:hypothetical protein